MGGAFYDSVDCLQEAPPVVLVVVNLDDVVFLCVSNRHIHPVPTALEGRVDGEQALVAGVHRGPDVQVLGQAQLAVLDAVFVSQHRPSLFVIAIQVFGNVFIRHYRVFRCPFIVSVKQLEQVTEYLCAVASVDFLDDKEHFVVRIVPRCHIGLHKGLGDKLVGDSILLLFGKQVTKLDIFIDFYIIVFRNTCELKKFGNIDTHILSINIGVIFKAELLYSCNLSKILISIVTP